MPQATNPSIHDTISEVSLKCGDIFYQDFPKKVYSQAIYRAERSVAKQYEILDRILTLTNITGEREIDINLLNFHKEWRIYVTKLNEVSGVDYLRASLKDVIDSSTSENKYYIIYHANKYKIGYSNPAVGDTIAIYYTSTIAGLEDYENTDNYGNDNIAPVIPDVYYEETLRRAVVYIAELGIANFSGVKLEKYQRLLQRYTRRSDIKDQEGPFENKDWIIIKPFILSYP